MNLKNLFFLKQQKTESSKRLENSFLKNQPNFFYSLKTSGKLFFPAVLIFSVFISCNKSNSKSQLTSSAINSKSSMAVIDNVMFNLYDKKNKTFFPYRKSELKYNSQGGTIEANHFKYLRFPAEKIFSNRYTAKYSDQMMTEFTSKRYESSRKTKYEFDTSGNVISTKYFEGKKEELNFQREEVFEYEDNLISVIKACAKKENECNMSINIKYEYDSLGRKTSTILDPNGDPDTVRFFYNDESLIPAKVETIPYVYIILSQDQKVMEIEKTYFDYYSSKYALEKKTIFTYDKKDRIILIEHATNHETSGLEYLYDELGNLAERKYWTNNRLGLEQTKYVFKEYKEYSNFAIPAWFVEKGTLKFKPIFDLNWYIGQLAFEKVEAKVLVSKQSIPSGYIEYHAKDKDNWIPYQEVKYNVTEF